MLNHPVYIATFFCELLMNKKSEVRKKVSDTVQYIAFKLMLSRLSLTDAFGKYISGRRY